MKTKIETDPKTATPKLHVAPEALLALGRLDHLNLASNQTVRDLRAQVPVGTHSGEVTLRLTYDLKVGEGYESEVAQSVPWKALAGLLFSKLNGATRDAIVREALVPAEGGGFELREGTENTEAEEAIQALMGKTKRMVAGKITGSAVLRVAEECG